MIKKTVVQNTDQSDKETVLLKAALKAYSVYGINKATTRQIASIAGIGKSTIYEYFKDKDALFNAAFHYLFTGMTENYKEIHEFARNDPLSALNIYLENTINVAINEPTTLLLISQYSLGIMLTTEKFEDAKSEYQKRMYPAMQSLIDEFRFIISIGIEKKVFNPPSELPVEGLVYIICALIREIQAQAFLQNNDVLLKTCSVIKETIYQLLKVGSKI